MENESGDININSTIKSNTANYSGTTMRKPGYVDKIQPIDIHGQNMPTNRAKKASDKVKLKVKQTSKDKSKDYELNEFNNNMTSNKKKDKNMFSQSEDKILKRNNDSKQSLRNNIESRTLHRSNEMKNFTIYNSHNKLPKATDFMFKKNDAHIVVGDHIGIYKDFNQSNVKNNNMILKDSSPNHRVNLSGTVHSNINLNHLVSHNPNPSKSISKESEKVYNNLRKSETCNNSYKAKEVSRLGKKKAFIRRPKPGWGFKQKHL